MKRKVKLPALPRVASVAKPSGTAPKPPGFSLRATPRSPVAIPSRASARGILAKASEAPRASARGILAKASESCTKRTSETTPVQLVAYDRDFFLSTLNTIPKKKAKAKPQIRLFIPKNAQLM